MNEPRNDYGFPYFPYQSNANMENRFAQMQNNACNSLNMVLGMSNGAALIGWRQPAATKLERAQAYAAEVRARKKMQVLKWDRDSE